MNKTCAADSPCTADRFTKICCLKADLRATQQGFMMYLVYKENQLGMKGPAITQLNISGCHSLSEINYACVLV